MSKINELTDRLIAIKDQLNNQYNKDTINEACGILAKIERDELVEVVRCKDCKYFYCASAVDRMFYCQHFQGLKHIKAIERDSFCSYGERSVEK